MKKTLKILMLIGIIALGINLTEVKAEEVTAPVTTAPQETTTKVEQPTTVQPTTKPDVDTTGKNVKKGGYVKKTVTAYNLKLEKVTKVKKGIRYYVYKKCNNGYSLIQVGNQKLLVESKYITYKCNAKKIVNAADKKYSYNDMKRDLKKLENAYGSIFKVDIAGKSLDKRNLYLVMQKLRKQFMLKHLYMQESI